MKIKQIIILILTVFIISGCYVDSSQSSDKDERSVLSLYLPIPEQQSKAADDVYYFEILLNQLVGGDSTTTYSNEVIIGSSDIMALDGSGAVFPIILTDVPTGSYVELYVRYYEPFNTTRVLNYSSYDTFEIIEGENTVVNITMESW